MVTLRKAAPEDFAQIARWLSRPEINRWLSSEWRNREVNPVAIAMLARNPRNAVFLILHHDKPCGMAALSEIDAIDRTANVWYFLGEPNLAGQGVTTEAIKQLLRLAFTELNFVSLCAWTMENNLASQRLLEKTGFQRAGRFRQTAMFDGKPIDRFYYDLPRSDWCGG